MLASEANAPFYWGGGHTGFSGWSLAEGPALCAPRFPCGAESRAGLGRPTMAGLGAFGTGCVGTALSGASWARCGLATTVLSHASCGHAIPGGARFPRSPHSALHPLLCLPTLQERSVPRAQRDLQARAARDLWGDGWGSGAKHGSASCRRGCFSVLT